MADNSRRSDVAVNGPPIPWAKPSFFGKEEAFVVDALRSSWISGGPYVDRLEKEIAELTGARCAIAVSNGTTALELAFRAIDLQPGDEVIVPAFTFVAPVNMALSLGATPVYVDVDPNTWLMDSSNIQARITKKTKAIVPVHLYGNVANMKSICEIANKHGVYVVEDAAEAAFSRCDGRCAGTFGTLGTFSFHATKTITTGEGGMVVTGDESLARKMRLLRDHAMKDRRYWHDVVGYNFRLTNLQAALGCAQLVYLEKIIVERRRILAAYRKNLASIGGAAFQSFEDYVDPVLWAFAIKLKSRTAVIATAQARRDAVMKLMAAKGIETRPGFYSLDLLPPYNCPTLPVASEVSANVLSLPTYVDITDAEIARICSSLETALHATE